MQFDLTSAKSAEDVTASLTQLLGLDSTWLVSFALGFIVVLLFAREQLNRPVEAETEAKRRARLMDMVAPAQLRSNAVFFRGYLFYAALLLLVYTLLSVGGASVISIVMAGAPAEAEMLDGGAAPLIVALAMVGLMPASPLFARIEKRFRMLAHDLVGVPTSFNEFTDALMAVRIDADTLSGELIGPAEAARLRSVLKRARDVFGDGPVFDRFAQGTIKLFAFRAWETGGPMWPSFPVRNEFKRLELEIAPVVDGVLSDLEDIALRATSTAAAAEPLLRVAGGAQSAQIAPSEPVAEGSADALHQRLMMESRWRALADRVHSAADDICALFALYAERAVTRPKMDNPLSALLRDLIDRAEARRSATAPHFDVLSKELLRLSVIMFGVGYVGHALTINPYPNATALDAGLIYATGVLLLYGPSSFVTWSARRSADARSAWRNAFAPNAVFPTLQYLGLFANAWLIAAITLMLYTLLQLMVQHVTQVSAADDGATANFQKVWDQFAAYRAGVPLGAGWIACAYALMGGFHAAMMALLQDLSDQRLCRGWLAVGVVGSHGLGLALICWVVAGLVGKIDAATQSDAIDARVAQIALDAAEAPQDDAAAAAAAMFEPTKEQTDAAEATQDDAAAAAAAMFEPTPEQTDALAELSAMEALTEAINTAHADAVRRVMSSEGLYVQKEGPMQAALLTARAAVAAEPAAMETAATAIVALDGDLELADARNRIRHADDGGGYPAIAGIWFEAGSAALFGWLSAFLMLHSLRVLGAMDRRGEAIEKLGITAQPAR